MSVEFLFNNDSFLRTQTPGTLSAPFPVTFAGWVKFGAVVNGKSFAQACLSSTKYHSLYRDWGSTMQARSRGSGGMAIAETLENAIVNDTWYFVALRRDAADNEYLYMCEYQGTPLKINVTQSIGSYEITTDNQISLGTADGQLNGTTTPFTSLKMAEWAYWDSLLTDAQLDNLKNGALPDTLSPTFYALNDGGNLTNSLVDQIAGNNLQIYGADAILGSGSVAPVYSADHPFASVVNNKIIVPIVIDNNDTPHPDATGVNYLIHSGADTANLTAKYSGSNGVISGGSITILTPDSNLGETLHYQHDVFFDNKTEYAYGTAIVQ